jgi:hypothetical protein
MNRPPYSSEHSSDRSLSISKPNVETPSRFSRLHARVGNLQGWRCSLFLFLSVSSLLLFLNVLFAIIGIGRHKLLSDGLGTFFTGSRKEVSSALAGLKLLVAIFSTLVFAAGTYTIQILLSPTRAELDRKHRSGKWMDIGVFSFRNFHNISPTRKWRISAIATCVLLLQFFYSGLLVPNLGVNDYYIFQVTPGFEIGQTWVANTISDVQDSLSALQSLATDSKLQTLSTKDCIAAYRGTYTTDRSHLLLVGGDADFSTGSFLGGAFSAVYEENKQDLWMCRQFSNSTETCDAQIVKFMANSSSWTPFGQQVDHCLSLENAATSSVSINIYVLSFVILFNFFLVGLMSIVLFEKHETDNLLITTGDAIATFMQDEDLTTRGICLYSRADVSKMAPHQERKPLVFQQANKHWYAGVGLTSWIMILIPTSILLLVLLALIPCSLRQFSLPGSGISALSFGLAPVSSQTLLLKANSWSINFRASPGLAGNTIVSCIFQVIICLVFLSFNNVLTRMYQAHEYATFGKDRKPLRVSANPIGWQYTTLYLSLPMSYSLPLTFLFVLLRWFTSAALFPSTISAFHNGVRSAIGGSHYISTASASPLALILLLVFMLLLLLFTAVLSARKLASAMPIAAPNSIAISAACHASNGSRSRAKEVLVAFSSFQTANRESSVVKLPIMWGSSGDDGSYGHAGFSSDGVNAPRAGVLYS